MTKLLASRSAQWPLVQEFTFDVSTAVNDTMATVVGNVIGGASPHFQATVQAIGGVHGGAGQIYEIFPLPVGATVIGGEVVVSTAVAGPTASTITIGDSDDADRYLGATNLKAAGRTAMVPTGRVGNGENVRMTITNTDAVATAGKVAVRLTYVMAGRTNEVIVS